MATPTETPLTTIELPPRFTVAVRTLCEFTAKRGDLDLRFTPSPTAQEGIAGHQLVAARRPKGYQTEVSLSGRYGPLVVRGRADGFDPNVGQLEEIKTHKGPLSRQPDNHRDLHWAQLKVYGALLCASQGRSELQLALVYLDVATGKETVLVERWSASDLQAFWHRQAEAFLSWALQEAAHRDARDASLLSLTFPHATFRQGQRTLAEGVFKVARAGRCLLAQAPTGIGKTMATVFSQLKAVSQQKLDKVFFLTAKTSGRGMALVALNTLHTAQSPSLRSLELVARDKSCEHPDKACHGASCPLASGFYDRLPAARQAAVEQAMDGPLVAAVLRRVALDHHICPYYLGQEMARWVDVVVGDYNHFFDLHAMLFALTQAQGWRVALLVDEAHNLTERARKMYSAELRQHSLAAARAAIRTTGPARLKRKLGSLQSAWRKLNQVATSPLHPLPSLPDDWLTALQSAVTAMAEYFNEAEGALGLAEATSRSTALHSEGQLDPVPQALRAFCLEALHLCKIAELFDEHGLCDLTSNGAQLQTPRSLSSLNLRNVVPAPYLIPRWAAAHSATLFSATLQPMEHTRLMLGLPESTALLEVESPFAAEQLRVEVAHSVSTRYAHRAHSLSAVVGIMARQFAAQPGNYLAFFSSHDYLQQVASEFQTAHTQVPVWVQQRRMSEVDQQSFLDAFTEYGQGIAFAVLGGSFGEGIDLPGRRLIGAFIATMGLPQVNPVNERMRKRLDELGRYGNGYNAVYLYPGVQRVVQAAGRVIRTTTDRGVLHLMDQRYGKAEVQGLLPGWWGRSVKVNSCNEESSATPK
ncbi:MAG: ATP-dependent DNA helicase [Burkholderiales bacterium PBB3]|nr:MAG: ATP-dependent DNA helicase [Burkholderiales bacterium PBB3]